MMAWSDSIAAVAANAYEPAHAPYARAARRGKPNACVEHRAGARAREGACAGERRRNARAARACLLHALRAAAHLVAHGPEKRAGRPVVRRGQVAAGKDRRVVRRLGRIAHVELAERAQARGVEARVRFVGKPVDRAAEAGRHRRLVAREDDFAVLRRRRARARRMEPGRRRSTTRCRAAGRPALARRRARRARAHVVKVLDRGALGVGRAVGAAEAVAPRVEGVEESRILEVWQPILESLLPPPRQRGESGEPPHRYHHARCCSHPWE